MKKTMPEIYNPSIIQFVILLQKQNSFNEALDVLTKFKSSFKDFDKESSLDDQEKLDFYLL